MLVFYDSECFLLDSVRDLGDKWGRFWICYFFKYFTCITRMNKSSHVSSILKNSRNFMYHGRG
eukprot:UN23545